MPNTGFFSETTRDVIAALGVVLALVQIYFVFRPPMVGRSSSTSEGSTVRKAARSWSDSEDLTIVMLLCGTFAIMLGSGAGATFTRERFGTISDLLFMLGKLCAGVLPLATVWFGAAMYEEATPTKTGLSTEHEDGTPGLTPIQVRRRLLAAWAALTLLTTYKVYHTLVAGELRDDVWGLLTFSSVLFVGSSVVACFIIAVVKIVRIFSRRRAAA